jgi:hypothetical protein
MSDGEGYRLAGSGYGSIVLLLMQIRPQRFEVRPEHPRGLDACRIDRRRRDPAVRAGE